MLLGALVGLASAAPALADDTEIFFNQPGGRGVRPNLLFIVDTSGSMNGAVDIERAPYDALRTYDGACESDHLYWSRESSPPPACDTTQFVESAQNRCAAAAVTTAGLAGFWTGRLAQWNEANVAWRPLRAAANEDLLECAADSGRHGADEASAPRYARNGDADSPWTGDETGELDWNTAVVHTLYSANWLNWYNGPPEATTLTRLDIVKSVVTAVAASVDEVNLGLMRFSDNGGDGDAAAQGGMVTRAIEDVATGRDGLIDNLNGFVASGFTPLSETLYEAGQYFAGRDVVYGATSAIEGGSVSLPSVPASRQPDDASRYRSPIEYQCQRNYVVLLTDGEPTRDRDAESRITSLPGFAEAAPDGCTGDGEGRCLPAMAEYLNRADLIPDGEMPGDQSAVTYTIGFGPEVAGSALLDEVARRGGGAAFSASDVTDLTETLQSIVSQILATSSTFTTPAVSINAFNRTQTLNELYVSVFSPRDAYRWPGNLKKYALEDGRIVDAFGLDAVDPATGFFRAGTQSLWSAARDEDRVESGGAVSRLPEASDRRLFTFIESAGQANLYASVNRIEEGNADLTAALLGVADGTATREELIGFLRGLDVQDVDGDGDTTETSRFMGDPLHARPALVSYGGSVGSPDPNDAVVLVPTNDGFLHAVDAETGEELWAFMPPELLGRVPELYRNPAVLARTYGLDGDVRILKFDANLDGIVDASAGDRVWAFFGMRRGGRWYYALDITDRSRPRLLWKIGPSDLPGVGETWSAPTIARVRVAGATQNGENLVLIFGGGYDEAQENYNYVTDTSGHRLYMVDAASGELLWYAGGPGGDGTPDLALPNMTNSIPARVSVLDLDGDQFADRLYAADMGGRVWRFDIFNGNSRASLVTGGVFARLGAGDNPDATRADNRRFYYAPDVALIQRRAADPYYNLAIGSGYRGHPLEQDTQDRFYSLRDRNPFAKRTQAQYNALDPVLDADLFDVTDATDTTVPAGAPGFRLELRLNGGWVGEKVLAEVLTVSGTILFPSYEPTPPGATNPCLPSNGRNRVYALSVDTGRAALDFNDDGVVDLDDRFTELAQTGIAGEVAFAFEVVGGSSGDGPGGGDDDGSGGDDDGTVDELGRRGVCVVGVEVLRKCVLPGGVIRTFWQRAAD